MRATAIALLALAAAACSDDKPDARTVPLSEAPEARGLRVPTAQAMPPEPVPEDAEAEAEGAEPVLPAGTEWLTVPGLGVDVGVPPDVRIQKPSKGGREIRLTDGAHELRLRRVDKRAAPDKAAVKAGLEKEAGKIGWIVDRAEGDEFRLEYVMMGRQADRPVFGLAMRRVIDGVAIDCASRGPETTSNKMAFDGCRAMRATPP